jgi:hypothetical protein
MITCRTKIQIGRYIFNYCINGAIKKSYEDYTTTCEIVLPNVLYRQKDRPVFNSELSSLIKQGDSVRVEVGYNNRMIKEFEGFVSSITVSDNITIVCEDMMWAVKQINVPSKSWASVTLKELIKYVLQGAKITVKYIDGDANLGAWNIDNQNTINPLQVFDELKKYGLFVFFKDNVLNIGKMGSEGVVHNYLMQGNVADDGLKWVTDSTIGLVLKGISNYFDSKKSKLELYCFRQNGELRVSNLPQKGEQRTLNFIEISQKELEKALKDNYDNYIYTGYSGSFKSFLFPNCQVNDIVNLFDLKFKERNGKYKVKGIIVTFGIDGHFREIEIDYKVG